jgi:hypothetical protein
MTELVFFSRCGSENQTIKIKAAGNLYLMNIFRELKQKFGIDTFEGIELKIFAFINKFQSKPTFFDGSTKIEDMGEMIEKKQVRHFEVFWKKPKTHGKQVVDNSPSEYGKVLFGYKRDVVVGGETTIIGDKSQGCFVEIPKGALMENTTISVKMLEVNSNHHGGVNNVTRKIMSDPNKANKDANH